MKEPRKPRIKKRQTAEMKAAQIAETWQAEAEQCWLRLLIEIPLHPMDEHLSLVDEICRDLCKTTQARVTVVFSFALNYREFLAIHFRLARSVQPTGDTINHLSPIAGAIVTRDPLRLDLATSLLENEIRRLGGNGDKEGIRKLQDLIKPPLEMHRNYQIWVAIDEILKEWATTRETRGHQSNDPPFPDTSDIRRWVASRRDDNRFGSLRTLDDNGWFRLREDCGINRKDQAYRILIELNGGSITDLELAGCRKCLESSIFEIGGRGEARIG